MPFLSPVGPLKRALDRKGDALFLADASDGGISVPAVAVFDAGGNILLQLEGRAGGEREGLVLPAKGQRIVGFAAPARGGVLGGAVGPGGERGGGTLVDHPARIEDLGVAVP